MAVRPGHGRRRVRRQPPDRASRTRSARDRRLAAARHRAAGPRLARHAGTTSRCTIARRSRRRSPRPRRRQIYHLAGVAACRRILGARARDLRRATCSPRIICSMRSARARAAAARPDHELGVRLRAVEPRHHARATPAARTARTAPASSRRKWWRCGRGKTIGIPALIARAFNHVGPRQAPSFVASSIAKQIAEIEAGPEAARCCRWATSNPSATSWTCATPCARIAR